MKLIEQSCEIWEQGKTLDDVWKHIERCGRVCYQSEGESEDSRKWVMDKAKAGHLSILEHGTVYLKVTAFKENDVTKFFKNNPYSKIMHLSYSDNWFITTNMRVMVESEILSWLKYICEPTPFHMKRVTISCITDLGVAREFNRHRLQSISEESTRYCNYGKKGFGHSLTYIKPSWMDFDNLPDNDVEAWDIVDLLFRQIEDAYMNLLEYWKPEQARIVLPLDLKVQTVHTAFRLDWEDFVNKRAKEKTGKVHPNMKALAKNIQALLKM